MNPGMCPMTSFATCTAETLFVAIPKDFFQSTQATIVIVIIIAVVK